MIAGPTQLTPMYWAPRGSWYGPHLLAHRRLLPRRGAPSAELLGPRQAQQAALGQQPAERLGHLQVGRVVGERAEEVGRARARARAGAARRAAPPPRRPSRSPPVVASPTSLEGRRLRAILIRIGTTDDDLLHRQEPPLPHEIGDGAVIDVGPEPVDAGPEAGPAVHPDLAQRVPRRRRRTAGGSGRRRGRGPPRGSTSPPPAVAGVGPPARRERLGAQAVGPPGQGQVLEGDRPVIAGAPASRRPAPTCSSATTTGLRSGSSASCQPPHRPGPAGARQPGVEAVEVLLVGEPLQADAVIAGHAVDPGQGDVEDRPDRRARPRRRRPAAAAADRPHGRGTPPRGRPGRGWRNGSA